jgi:hypothetical protein
LSTTLRIAALSIAAATLGAGCTALGDHGPAAGPASSPAPAPSDAPSTAGPASTSTSSLSRGELASRDGGPAPSAAAGAGRLCQPADLLVATVPYEVGGVVSVNFYNSSGSACSVRGYLGLELLDAARRPMDTPLRQVEGDDVKITLDPEMSATTDLSYLSGAGCPTPGFVALTLRPGAEPIVERWPGGSVCAGLGEKPLELAAG